MSDALRLVLLTDLQSLEARLGAAVQTLTATVLTNQEKVMATLADIASAQTAESAAITAAVGDINNLMQQLTAAQSNQADPTEIANIVSQMQASTAALNAVLPAQPALATAAAPAPELAPSVPPAAATPVPATEPAAPPATT